jgi:hypothetical protein
MIFGCVELGAFLYLGDEQGNGINPLYCGCGLRTIAVLQAAVAHHNHQTYDYHSQ